MLPLLLAAAAVAEPLSAICTWADAPWDHHAELRLPGTNVAYAHASRSDDVHVGGTLGVDPADPLATVRFRATLEGAGVRAEGDIDADEPLWSLLDAPVQLGDAGVLPIGSLVDVVGFGERGARVTAHAWAREDFRTYPGQGYADVPCERLTILWRPMPERARQLADAGIPADAPERALARRGAVLVREDGGAPIGVIPRSKHPRTVTLVEERDGRAKVAIPHWTGVVWTGWIPAARLAPPDDGRGGGGLGMLLGSGGKESVDVVRCARPLALTAVVGPRTAVVGELAAGVPLRVVTDHGDSLAIELPGSWLGAVEGAELRVEGAARSCPADTVERPAPAL